MRSILILSLITLIVTSYLLSLEVINTYKQENINLNSNLSIIYHNVILDLLQNKYKVYNNNCETSKFETDILFKLLNNLQPSIDIMKKNNKYFLVDRPDLVKLWLESYIESEIKELNCEDIEWERHYLSVDIIEITKKLHKISDKYIPLSIEEFEYILEDQNHEVTQLITQQKEMMHKINMIINSQIACAKRKHNYEYANILQKEKNCNEDLMIIYK